MKTIVETSSKLSKFLLADDVEVVSTTTEITIGNPQASNPAYIVVCHSSLDTTLYTSVTNAPSNWSGNRYTFDGTTWTANPDWIDPTLEDEK
jgi:hypothetical protein|tara:strand:+ start:180 stop:455 length:276 start_codon:yes stop_codon:yes gene_type:complete